MSDGKINKNHSRIVVILEGEYHHKLVNSCERSARSKRAEIQLRIEHSLLTFVDAPPKPINKQ